MNQEETAAKTETAEAAEEKEAPRAAASIAVRNGPTSRTP